VNLRVVAKFTWSREQVYLESKVVMEVVVIALVKMVDFNQCWRQKEYLWLLLEVYKELRKEDPDLFDSKNQKILHRQLMLGGLLMYWSKMIMRDGLIMRMQMSRWQEVIDLNLTIVFLWSFQDYDEEEKGSPVKFSFKDYLKLLGKLTIALPKPESSDLLNLWQGNSLADA
ncbi:hypothetical protein Tco_1389314, partial [Tanacetum coccineum]